MHVYFHRENRYLLFITENYAALEVLKQYLKDNDNEHESEFEEEEEVVSTSMEDKEPKPWELEPFILFGSSFPQDKEYAQVG